MIHFEWDDEKNIKNIKKHKVSFEEASKVFYDDNAILFDDPDHSIEEQRFLIIGQSEDDKHLLVSHCYRDKDDEEIIRLISARKATKHEKKLYEEGA